MRDVALSLSRGVERAWDPFSTVERGGEDTEEFEEDEDEPEEEEDEEDEDDEGEEDED